MKKQNIEINITELKSEELKAAEQALVQAALEATRQSYAPYSNFHVGAAVLMEDGTILTGSNQENEAYPSGLCAERVALFHAGHQCPNKKIEALAITARQNGSQVGMVTPCGACRQVMLEYERKQNHPIAIYLYGTRGIIKIGEAADLLPLAFKL